jgi:sporulation protein YlmC with PRC-barrel domain
MVHLEDSGLELAHPPDDVRGLTVVDPNGHRVGEVDELIIDEEERRVRLLVVASGGILGLGRTRRLVPVDAVTWVDDVVLVEASHERVHCCSEYHPGRAPSPRFEEVYAHFSYLPFWGPSYAHPYFLRRP